MDFYHSHFIDEKTKATRKLRNLPKVTQLVGRKLSETKPFLSEETDAIEKTQIMILSVRREAAGSSSTLNALFTQTFNFSPLYFIPQMKF